MEYLVFVLKWPLILVMAVVCHKDTGITVKADIQQDRYTTVNVICHRPRIRMRVYKEESAWD